MIVETRVFNPSVCTCGKHGCDPHYRMERRVVWSNKAEEDARKMKRDVSKQDPENGHNDNIGKEDDSADCDKEVANVSVKIVIGEIDDKCSGNSVDVDGGKRNCVDCMKIGECSAGVKRNWVDCMENGDCGDNGISGEIEFFNSSIDNGSIENGPGDKSCIGRGEDSIGCGEDGCVDCMDGYGCIGNDPGDRSCIGRGEYSIGCGDDGCVDCMTGYGCIGNDPGDNSCIGRGEDSIGCGDDGCVDCMVGYGCIGNDPGDRSCIRNGEDSIGCGDDGCVDCIVGDNSSGNDGGCQKEEMCTSFGLMSTYAKYWYGVLGRSWHRLRR